MTAKIIVKCIIYNRVLNKFLLMQRWTMLFYFSFKV